MIKRIIFDLVFIGAIFYTPWWVVAPVAFAGAFMFPTYYEIFAFGTLFDLLYGTRDSSFYGTVAFVAAIGIFFIARYAKSMVRPA